MVNLEDAGIIERNREVRRGSRYGEGVGGVWQASGYIWAWIPVLYLLIPLPDLKKRI